MTLHPTTALQLAHERQRDLERLAAPAAAALSRRPRRFRRTLRRAVPAPITRTT
jgi:hypothetical protein